MSRLACPYRMDVIEPKEQNGCSTLALCLAAEHLLLVNKSDPPSTTQARRGFFVLAIAICLLVACVILAGVLGFQTLKNVIGSMNAIDPAAPISGALMTVLFFYTLLLAVPFMPGIEIGVALLVLRGAEIAPYVYLATVSGLMLAFFIGCCVPLGLLERGFLTLRLRSAANFVNQIQTMPTDDRLALYRSQMPAWLAPIAVDYRYVALAALINIPGTFAIGGGGGILLTVGCSGLFRARFVLLTVMIATLPIPLMVWTMGAKMLGGS